jgi:FdrA protein
MITRNVVKKNFYNDSVSLMLLSSKLSGLDGIKEAAVMMGTDHNKALMKRSGLLLPESETASPNDMIVAVMATDEQSIEAALETVEEHLTATSKTATLSENELVARTQDTALKMLPDANLALISVPGRYAAAEARKALDKNLNVFLFSDNISIEEEKDLKDAAVDKGLLMMGPDCGTAIINGVGLGFANAVQKGPIGLVAAAGTGLQEVTYIIDKLGGGISQALGTGGRDIKAAVGGTIMLMGLKALANDPVTKVIVLISKPPEGAVLKKLNAALATVGKPVVTCFLGAEMVTSGDNLHPVRTLEEAAIKAVQLSGVSDNCQAQFIIPDSQVKEIATAEGAGFQVQQKYLRGLFSGGTLCYEAMLVLRDSVGEVYSNVPLDQQYVLADPEQSKKHTLIDMGDDYFTDGRPHPMIDPGLRVDRFKREALDPETAVILLDVVIGYGSHADPAGALVSAISEAKAAAVKAGRYLSVVASVCGTEDDPQNLKEQEKKLRQSGVIVMPSNAQAAVMAAAIIASQK